MYASDKVGPQRCLFETDTKKAFYKLKNFKRFALNTTSKQSK